MPNLVLSNFTYNVLFCHAIETRDPSHLENLSAVVRALQILPRDASDIYGKQRRVFELMYNVACKYVGESGSTEDSRHHSGRPSGTSFGILLAEAGIPRPGETQMDTEIQSFQTQMEYGPDMQFGGMG
ncbi:uncharacterized protein BKA55DRAFT_543336 [Fusarium redolens]|uniref:Uncharacterized protein n=1 Tax=Fusarium redolens TaxID=48865 RepID=A0A9P9JU20_FUSRE|nr:uncharacterized protein BKA55DRAFT_543336 [Fusarium redolens]KAH7237822.1 hypothetical protein BKA55DRAFT_543336 [Fusarium redolens]